MNTYDQLLEATHFHRGRYIDRDGVVSITDNPGDRRVSWGAHPKGLFVQVEDLRMGLKDRKYYDPSDSKGFDVTMKHLERLGLGTFTTGSSALDQVLIAKWGEGSFKNSNIDRELYRPAVSWNLGTITEDSESVAVSYPYGQLADIRFTRDAGGTIRMETVTKD